MIFFIVCLYIQSAFTFITMPDRQLGCVLQAIGNNEIIAQESVDVDQNGSLDELIIYGDKDLFLIIAQDSSTASCKIVFNEYLISRKLITGWQKVTVRSMEQIELTGDNIPEIHIWLEKTGGGPREEVALHAIYSLQESKWQEVFIFTQCLAFSSFEFRVSQGGAAKEIYTDQDRHCEPPWSSGRTYNLLQWNGSRFVTVESGIVPNSVAPMYLAWLNYACLIAFIVLIVILLRLVWVQRKEKMEKPL